MKDTITVTSNSIQKECYEIDSHVYCWDNMEVLYLSSATHKTFSDSSGDDHPQTVHRSIVEPMESVFATYSFANYPAYPDFCYRANLDIMKLNGKTYRQVYIFHADNKALAGTPEYRPFDFYWAPNVGNIKKVIYEGDSITSWILIYMDVHQ